MSHIPAAVLRYRMCRKVCALLPAIGRRTGHRFCRHRPGRNNCGHCDREQYVPQHDWFPLDQSYRKLNVNLAPKQPFSLVFVPPSRRTRRCERTISQSPTCMSWRGESLQASHTIRRGSIAGEPRCGLAARSVSAAARIAPPRPRRTTWNECPPILMPIAARSRLIVGGDEAHQAGLIGRRSIRSKRRCCCACCSAWRSVNLRRYRVWSKDAFLTRSTPRWCCGGQTLSCGDD
jgi:hypothetical protein